MFDNSETKPTTDETVSLYNYFYSLFVFWLALRARQNTAQLVKIYSDTTHQNV